MKTQNRVNLLLAIFQQTDDLIFHIKTSLKYFLCLRSITFSIPSELSPKQSRRSLPPNALLSTERQMSMFCLIAPSPRLDSPTAPSLTWLAISHYQIVLPAANAKWGQKLPKIIYNPTQWARRTKHVPLGLLNYWTVDLTSDLKKKCVQPFQGREKCNSDDVGISNGSFNRSCSMNANSGKRPRHSVGVNYYQNKH